MSGRAQVVRKRTEWHVLQQPASPALQRACLDAGVDVGGHGGGAVQAVLEGAVPRLDGVADGARVVFQASSEEDQLQGRAGDRARRAEVGGKAVGFGVGAWVGEPANVVRTWWMLVRGGDGRAGRQGVITGARSRLAGRMQQCQAAATRASDVRPAQRAPRRRARFAAGTLPVRGAPPQTRPPG